MSGDEKNRANTERITHVKESTVKAENRWNPVQYMLRILTFAQCINSEWKIT